MTKLLKDVVVKKLFTSGTEASKEFLFRIISAVTDIKIKDLENDFELIHTEPSVNNNIINMVTNSGGEDTPKRQPVKVQKKIGRNDPCPCGSGKKYKNCCGKNV